MSKSKVYIVDGARTPFLKARGKHGAFSAADLAVQAGRSLLMRHTIQASNLDEVIIGCVMPEPDEMNIARIIALRLGCGNHVPAWTVQRNCASGMQALDAARLKIIHGESQLILAGGTEVMSHAPLLLAPQMVDWLTAWQKTKSFSQKIKLIGKFRPAFLIPIIGLLHGLTDPIAGLNMGQTSEILAHRFNISRNDMDTFAQQSHQKAAAAISKHELEEIIAITSDQGVSYTVDDGVRQDSSLEKLGTLATVFDKPFGQISAGNSAQITDGAAMILLASDEAVNKYQLPIMGTIDDVHWAGLAPEQMGLGPAYAIPPLLIRNQLHIEDIDAWEMNEAFAAQVQANRIALNDVSFCQEALGLDHAFGSIAKEKLNREGGAIAIGHPVGASGARIVLHLLHSMKKHNETKGVASLCIGGGQGGAMLVSRLTS